MSGLEEQNVDCAVTITLNASRADVTNQPPAPLALSARATAGGGAVLDWVYAPPSAANAPTGFHVYVGVGAPSFGSPVATVPYAGQRAFQATLSGLTGGSIYAVAVRAYNAIAEEQNANLATFTAASTAPTSVRNLTATATSQGA